MFIKWDIENNQPIGEPAPAYRDESESWFPLVMTESRSSRTQTLIFTFDSGVVYGDWVGSPNPEDETVSTDELRVAWKEILQMPLQTADEKVFQFDLDSERLMSSAIVGLNANQASTLNWRLLDNSTISVDAAQLQSYYDELKLAQSERGFLVDAEYVAFKLNLPTRSELTAWKNGYQL